MITGNSGPTLILNQPNELSWLPSSPFCGGNFIISITYFLLIKITLLRMALSLCPCSYRKREGGKLVLHGCGGGGEHRDREGERKGGVGRERGGRGEGEEEGEGVGEREGSMQER